MTPAQFAALNEMREGPKPVEQTGTEADWAMIASLPMGG